MVIVIGEILIDRFGETWRVGGAPFNFAFHLKKMGLPVRFVSRVGADPYGSLILKLLERHGFPAVDLQIDNHHPTGTVEVELDHAGVPRYDIRCDVAYDHLDLDSFDVPDPEAVRLIYLGTLLQRTDGACAQVRRFLARRPPGAECLCDINMRPPHVNFSGVDNGLEACTILKLNDDELETLQGRIAGPAGTDAYVGWLMNRFAIDTLALTLGAGGSAIYQHGQVVRSGPVAGPEVVDTVGAGDGYAAVLALGCLKRLAPRRTIGLAAGFASRICGIRGAIPDDDKMYDELLAQMKGDDHGR